MGLLVLPVGPAVLVAPEGFVLGRANFDESLPWYVVGDSLS